MCDTYNGVMTTTQPPQLTRPEAASLAAKLHTAAVNVTHPGTTWELFDLSDDLYATANGRPTWLTT